MRLRLFAALFVAGCSQGSIATPTPQSPVVAQPVTVTAPSSSPAPGPRLVIAVVLDQFPSWAFKKYAAHLDEKGLIRMAMKRGETYLNVRYPYASTFTAPGHAALFTGHAPVDTGIVSNKLYDRGAKKNITSVYDPRYPVLGSKKKSAAPTRLRIATVGDFLRTRTRGKAKVFSISLKDRAAVLPAGKKGNLAVFYDAKQGRFTTSTYYANQVPEWLVRYQAKHPIKELLRPWKVADKELCRRVTGSEDAAPGEANYDGFGVEFPHDPAATSKPFKRLVLTPQLSEYMIDLAEHGVEQLELGRDTTTDLLTLSISGTDYVGHTFGAASWEYFDNLRRVDRALGQLVTRLEKKIGPVALLLSSDHGVQKLPEQGGRGRLYGDVLLAKAKEAAQRELGEGDWVARFAKPFLFLTDAGMRERERLVPAIVTAWHSLEGVQLAVDPRKTEGWRNHKDPVKRAVGLAFDRNVAAEVYVIPKPDWVVDEYRSAGGGTNHGTPWTYDTDVPLLFWGPGIAKRTHKRVVSQLCVAPTLASLLGFEMNNAVEPSLIQQHSTGKQGD